MQSKPGITALEVYLSARDDERGDGRPFYSRIERIIEVVGSVARLSHLPVFVKLPALLPEFAGKVDLIYIDPPFDTGADFSFQVQVDGESFTKEPSVIEQKAYRDTWGRGLDSYLQWFYDSAAMLSELLKMTHRGLHDGEPSCRSDPPSCDSAGGFARTAASSSA